MIEQLFGSKTRVKLLQLFYGNPNRSFYVREITRKIDEQINSVRRELSNLLSIGIITSETTNNKLYYEVNQKYELYLPLAQIFGGVAISGTSTTAKTVEEEGSPDQMPADLKPLGHVELAVFTGQFTRDERSGVDFMVVGDINQTQIAKYVAGLEEKEGKEIRYAYMTKKEYLYRQQINDRFLAKVIESKKQVIFDRHLLEPTIEPEEPKKEKTAKSTKKG